MNLVEWRNCAAQELEDLANDLLYDDEEERCRISGPDDLRREFEDRIFSMEVDEDV